MHDAELRRSLIELLDAIGQLAAAQVLIGGGYGLYLKQLRLAQTRQRTLIDAELWPAPRATEDLDLFLATEVIADPAMMKRLREALDDLGYQPIPGAEFYQFARTVGRAAVKIDLLTSQLDQIEAREKIAADERRARSTDAARPKLHAHPTEGAVALDEHALEIEIDAGGKQRRRMIRIPNAYTYTLMKLTAYRDRREDADKELGRHHALDVFRIVAMLTEAEDVVARDLAKRYAGNPVVEDCRRLAASDFASPTSLGCLRIREHPLWMGDEAGLGVFIEVLPQLI